MSSFGPAAGSIWENWLRDHRDWMNESRDAGGVPPIWKPPIRAASTPCATYDERLKRRPNGTLLKGAGASLWLTTPDC